jgi:hypothetical protein
MHLVSGTDAEGRYLQGGELVKKELYEAAARQLAALPPQEETSKDQSQWLIITGYLA